VNRERDMTGLYMMNIWLFDGLINVKEFCTLQYKCYLYET